MVVCHVLKMRLMNSFIFIATTFLLFTITLASDSSSSSMMEDEIGGELSKNRLLKDIQRSMEMTAKELRLSSDVTKAVNDFTELWSTDDDKESSKRSIGHEMFLFLHGLATSYEFKTSIWQNRPLYLSSSDINIDNSDHQHFPRGLNSFTVSDDVLPAYIANDGSFFSPYIPKNINPFNTWSGIIPTDSTDDSENDKDEDPWTFLSTEKFENHITKHTCHFDEAGTKFPKIGALNRLANYAFGLPVTINMYISPIGLFKSLPLHTDPQDIFIFQTQGVKHWYVYAPPPTKVNVDPFNRGKNGDIIRSHEIPNGPLIDTILCPGDVLYIPAGFPHTADTIMFNEAYESVCGREKKNVLGKSNHSVHLTLGIETHYWALTYAHLRYSLLTKFQLKNEQLTVENKAHWQSMHTLNVGFLASPNTLINADGESTIDSRKASIQNDDSSVTDIINELKYIMTQLEPKRWRSESGIDLKKQSHKENMPSIEKFQELIDFVIEIHLPTIMILQDQMNDISNEMNKKDLLARMKRIKTLQHYIMKEYWTFSNDKYMMSFYTS